jgi:hypothetical protein
VKNPLDADASRIDGCLVSDIGIDDLDIRIALVLDQIGATADNEIVKDPDATPFGKKPVDQVASDESGTTCHKITTHASNHTRLDPSLQDSLASNN